MDTIINLCFLCTKYYNCVLADERIVSQVEYLLPEITIIKLGIPLRICSVCNEALCAFSKFKQSSVESSRRLEARIKGVQGPPLYTGSPPDVDDSEASGATPEKMEEIFIKQEYVEQTPLDTQLHPNRTFLNPMALSQTISAEPHNQLHKARVSQNIQLHTDTISDNREEISVKEEQIEETPQNSEFYKNILQEECISNLMNDYTTRQPKHNKDDETATLNTSEEVWKGRSADSETVEETDGNCSKNIQTVSCTVCKKIFLHKYDLNKHMDLHNGIKNFPCSICKKRFFNKRNLKQHIKLHNERKENKTHTRVLIKDSSSYSICNKEFKDKNIIHQNIKIQCKICDKSFTQKAHLTRHLKIHSGVKEFQCEFCEKSFSQNYTLTRHMKIHSDVKEFQCEICEKSFTLKDHLTRHMKLHSGVKDFQCGICDKLYTNRSSLICHMKVHSGIKDFWCELCGKSFTQKVHLTCHIKIHTGVKDFHCEICKKSFIRKSNLTSHMKIHSGRFKCHVCHEIFTKKNDLFKHVKNH